MGFLSELGQFAGGVSKGISQEAVDRARREQAKAAKQEREEKERLASQDIEAAKATAIRRGTTYEPPVHEKPTLQGDISNAAGALAKLFGKKDVDTTAQIAGVRPMPTLGVDMPGPPGSPSGAPAPAAAPATAPDMVAAPRPGPANYDIGSNVNAPGLGLNPAAAPAAAPAVTGAPKQVAAEVLLSPEPIKEDPAPQGYQHPTKVPDRAGQPGDMRDATPIDKQFQLAVDLAHVGKWKESNEANDKYTQMVAQKTVGNVPYMTMPELSTAISKTLSTPDQKRNIVASQSDDGRYTLTDVTDPKNPQVMMRNETIGHVQAMFANELGLDPTLRAQLATDSDHNFQAILTGRSEAGLRDAQAAALKATAAATTQGTKFAAGDREIKLADMADDKWLAIPGSSVADPVRAARQAADPANIKMKETVDPASGAVVKTPYNPAQEKIDKETHDWQTNGWSKPDKTLPGGQGVVQRVQSGNAYGFAVLGPDGQYMREPNGQTAVFETPVAAYQHAFDKYGKDPTVAAAKIRAGMAGQKPAAAPAAGQKPAAAPGGPKPAAAAAPGGPKPGGPKPGLPTAPLTPKQKAAAQIAAAQEGAKGQKEKAAAAKAADDKADAQTASDIADLKAERFEYDKRRLASGDIDERNKMRGLMDATSKRIRELEAAQRARRSKSMPGVGLSDIGMSM
jgi:hypothetical protein